MLYLIFITCADAYLLLLLQPLPPPEPEVAPSTPPPTTIQDVIGSPELLGEIKTAGALEMERDNSFHGSRDLSHDFANFGQGDHIPDFAVEQPAPADTDEIMQEELDSHPESQASGPPTSNSSPSEDTTVDIMDDTGEHLNHKIYSATLINLSLDHTPTRPSVAGTSRLPLFLPSEDEEVDGSGSNLDQTLDTDSDHFVLDATLLPFRGLSLSPRVEMAVSRRGRHSILADNDVNVSDASQSTTRKRKFQASTSPSGSKRRMIMSHVEVPPLQKRPRKIKSEKTSFISELEAGSGSGG